MQSLEAAGLYAGPAFLAGSIKPLIKAQKCLVEGVQLILGGVVDDLQGLVVLQLDGTIPGSADMSRFQRIAPGGEQLLDQAGFLSWL